MNHPNRGKRTAASNPLPPEITAAREFVGLTREAAGALIFCGLRAWAEWEAGNRRMHPALWALWQHRVGLKSMPPFVAFERDGNK